MLGGMKAPFHLAAGSEAAKKLGVEKMIDFGDVKSEPAVCAACRDPISDRYLLQVSEASWHVACLRCSVCGASLEQHQSCFIKGDDVFCREDYIKSFSVSCAKCTRCITASDWVRRARNNVYHLACFACDACKRQLSTGEEFGLHDNRVLCKAHYQEILDGGGTSNDESEDGKTGARHKSKRVRTTFTDEQLQILQANFELDSNPDGHDLERIAQVTGLTKRVIQVWFQNSRARQKRYQNGMKVKGNFVSHQGLPPSSQGLTPPKLDYHLSFAMAPTADVGSGRGMLEPLLHLDPEEKI
ncbi:LIM/homeobox protein Awh-like isoform X2 [Amphibalanus amphitrite]|uniref:LIM/homeobox protein Awh-like isoform X2 n=1 Tax=Amphibalanus amphitrite TaxID=1232801 RepID=UPI001C914DB3|nr:LIM/homeobox protein Awh-like isoform X2 [Amphibalanus amphitrite]